MFVIPHATLDNASSSLRFYLQFRKWMTLLSMNDTLGGACGPRISSGEIRRERGYQTRSGNAEGAGAAPTASGGAAASGCTAGQDCSMGRVLATIGDALEPTT